MYSNPFERLNATSFAYHLPALRFIIAAGWPNLRTVDVGTFAPVSSTLSQLFLGGDNYHLDVGVLDPLKALTTLYGASRPPTSPS